MHAGIGKIRPFDVFVGVVLTALLCLLVTSLSLSGSSRDTPGFHTQALIRLLAEGCDTYKVDYGVYPPSAPFSDSRCLHYYLGRPRVVKDTDGTPGGGSIRTKGPIIEFPSSILQGHPSTSDPTRPLPIVDRWGGLIRYSNPGVHNKRAVDIWSAGANGIDEPNLTNSDDITNWLHDY